MASGHIKQTDARTHSEGFKDMSCTPNRGLVPNSVSCDIKTTAFELTVEFSHEEVATMISSLPDYMPTMDAALRFMRSNPETSADMMAELTRRREGKTI